MTARSFDTYRVTRLTCSACGFSDRVRILVIGSTEVMPECNSCGRPDAWTSWPTLAEPATPALERGPSLIEPLESRTMTDLLVRWQFEDYLAQSTPLQFRTVI